MMCLMLCYDNWNFWPHVMRYFWQLLLCSYGGECVCLPHVDISSYYMMMLHMFIMVSLCLHITAFF